MYGKVSLLTVKEAEWIPKDILNCEEWWWLRTQGYYSYFASCVDDSGCIYRSGFHVYSDRIAVRPALYGEELPGIGEKVSRLGETWTVVLPGVALCDRCVGRSSFRKEWRSPDANDYEKSDVKAWLVNWTDTRGGMPPARIGQKGAVP